MSRARALAPRIALVVVSCLIGLAIVEVVLRLAGPPKNAEVFRQLHEPRPDREWLYGLKPGAAGLPDEPTDPVRYEINAEGFRDVLYEKPKPEDVYRILVLGDSLAFGYGVPMEATFPKLMEKTLRHRVRGIRIQVPNFGVGGYNPYNQLHQLHDLGPAFEPDLVLVQFCINDLNDPTLHFDHHARQRLGAIPDAAFPDPAKRLSASSTYGLAERVCHQLEVCLRLYAGYLERTAAEPDQEARLAGLQAIERTEGAEWLWLEEHYAEMAKSAASMGARFAVLAFPFPGQMTGDSNDAVQARLRRMGDERGWVTLDPLPAFQQAFQSGRKLFIDWWHPTLLGHRIAARETLAQLACAGLLPHQADRLCLRRPDAGSDAG